MSLRNLYIWLTLFSIAMAFMESAVVVYIRELLYPEGFGFPLATLDTTLAVTEIIRELATLVMLAGAGIIAGKTFSQRFGWFLYCFAVWDIFYYIFLKALIGWPASIMEWDVLFLIPVTWTGPVLSPLLVCILMIGMALIINHYGTRGYRTIISGLHWGLLISGALVLILAFTWDYSGFILEHYSLSEIWNLPSKEPLFQLATSYVPRRFNWPLFWAGYIIVGAGIILLFRTITRARIVE